MSLLCSDTRWRCCASLGQKKKTLFFFSMIYQHHCSVCVFVWLYLPPLTVCVCVCLEMWNTWVCMFCGFSCVFVSKEGGREEEGVVQSTHLSSDDLIMVDFHCAYPRCLLCACVCVCVCVLSLSFMSFHFCILPPLSTLKWHIDSSFHSVLHKTLARTHRRD